MQTSVELAFSDYQVQTSVELAFSDYCVSGCGVKIQGYFIISSEKVWYCILCWLSQTISQCSACNSMNCM